MAMAALMLSAMPAHAGTWTALNNAAPSGINLMLLLPDGTVMAQAGGATNQWWKLTPDSHGSYINGSWTTLASMHDTRLYGASDVLPDGRVFIAGAEYGTGGDTAEVYDPQANTWTMTPASGQHFSDNISTTLPNGNVLIAPVGPSTPGGTIIFNIATNSWVAGPKLFRGTYQDEASWVKLPDGSVLTVDPFGTNSERYIPSSNQWIDDAVLPVSLYDSLGELGAATLLANGKAFFIGGTGHTALYTPSGNNNPGQWAAGPDLPNAQGQSDAPCAMMVNGKVLCAVGPKASYNPPTSFYEYDPNANSFTQVNGPTGTTDNVPAYGTRFLDLPDGNVLFSDGGNRLYEYNPGGAPLAAGKPTVTNVSPNADGSYQLTGKLLTGISQGAGYGDDCQMDTNYPIVKLTDGSGNVYFCRSYRWSDTGVMEGSTVQATQFRTPANLPGGSYSLQVVTNGIASDPVPFPPAQPWFMIINQNSGKALDLIGGNTTNGAFINQWTADVNSGNQRWALMPTPKGNHFKLISWVTGKAASIANDSTAVNAQLWDWDFTGDNPGQEFDLVDMGNGWYNIKNVNSGLVLDVANFSTADNATVLQWNATGGSNQKWRLQPWGNYYIRAASGRYICIQGAGSTNGSPIIQYDQQNNPWFKWKFTNEGDGWYGLFSLNAPTRVLCVVGGSTANAANCHLWDYNPSNVGDQKIRIAPQLDGKFKFYFAHDGMSWDIPGGQTGNNVPLQQYPNNSFPWQEFSLERIP